MFGKKNTTLVPKYFRDFKNGFWDPGRLFEQYEFQILDLYVHKGSKKGLEYWFHSNERQFC